MVPLSEFVSVEQQACLPKRVSPPGHVLSRETEGKEGRQLQAPVWGSASVQAEHQFFISEVSTPSPEKQSSC